MTLRNFTRGTWFLLVLLAATTAGCQRSEKDGCDCAQLEGKPVDPELMAFLSRARAAHHQADLNEDDPVASAKPLLSLVSGPLPKDTKDLAAEVREVLADTHARLADLESKMGQFDRASQRIEDSLKLVPEVSYFRGHLFETAGLVAERKSAHLLKQGQTKEADEQKARAIAAFEKAMDIQAMVIHKAAPQGNQEQRPQTTPPAQP